MVSDTEQTEGQAVLEAAKRVSAPPEEGVKFHRVSPPIKTPEGIEVPVRDHDETYYSARYATAHLLFTVQGGEIRIPYVNRDEKGHFKGCMDELVDSLGVADVRFTNVVDESVQGTPLEQVFTSGDRRTLLEALDGFERDVEMWQEYGDQESETVVGTWRTE